MAMGQPLMMVVLTNHSPMACQLDGYATLTMIGTLIRSDGTPLQPDHALATDESHGGSMFRSDPGPHIVSLRAGRSGLFYVVSSIGAGAHLAQAHAIAITLPGGATPIRVALASPGFPTDIEPNSSGFYVQVTALQAQGAS